MRRLAVIAVLALASCGDEPDQVRTDCFAASPQQQPTRGEVESFASVKLPPGAAGFSATCRGAMDKSLSARFELRTADIGRFLRRSGFTARRPSERGTIVREDRPQQAYRRLAIRVDGSRATVHLNAFET